MIFLEHPASPFVVGEDLDQSFCSISSFKSASLAGVKEYLSGNYYFDRPLPSHANQVANKAIGCSL